MYQYRCKVTYKLVEGVTYICQNLYCTSQEKDLQKKAFFNGLYRNIFRKSLSYKNIIANLFDVL